jgi:hypothetical protein
MEITDNESGMPNNERALVLPPHFVAIARRLAGFWAFVCTGDSRILQAAEESRGSRNGNALRYRSPAPFAAERRLAMVCPISRGRAEFRGIQF